MSRVVSSLNITLDGFCPHDSVVADNEHHDHVAALVEGSGLVLLGRRTYDLFADFWPTAAAVPTLPASVRRFARALASRPRVVATSSPDVTPWAGTTVEPVLDRGVVDRLKAAAGEGDILVFGSPGLVSSLSRLGLVDVYEFLLQPIVAGRGPRLFDTVQRDKDQALELTHQQRFASGVLALRYTVQDGARA